MPQPGRVDVAAQERVVRVLAARLLPTVGDKDAARAAEILKDARDINPEIASIGVRQANGDIFASTQRPYPALAEPAQGRHAPYPALR